MSAFAYQSPSSIEELLATLADAKSSHSSSRILAGGTDLLVQMKNLVQSPELLIDIKRVPEAMQIKVNAQQIIIGTAVPSATIYRHQEVRQCLPGLTEAAYLIGSSQIQSRASIGGNLCNASPAGDTIPALIVNAAMCHIKGASGERRIKVEDFITGVQQNCLDADEFLLALEIEKPAQRTADAYQRFTPRTEMDIAVVGVGVRLVLDDENRITHARVGVGAVAITALLVEKAAKALIGSKLEDDALEAAAAEVAAGGSPISDKRGSADFRRRIAAVLTKRVAKIAYQRARKFRS